MLLSLRAIFLLQFKFPEKQLQQIISGDFQLKGKGKKARVKVTLSTQNSVRQFVGQLQQSKNRHLLIRRNLKFDFNIRTSTCYITTLTLLHSTPFINFPFVNITKLTDQKKHYSFL